MSQSPDKSDGSKEKVSVCVRVRPFNSREIGLQQQEELPLQSTVKMPAGQSGNVIFRATNSQEKKQYEFSYTKSFWSIPDDQEANGLFYDSQEDVYNAVGPPLITSVFEGKNICVFAYGQTGSGKTYTMMGDVPRDVYDLGDNAGLIPRLCRDLFDRIESEMAVFTGRSYKVTLDAIEIYNEEIRDLLSNADPPASLTLHILYDKPVLSPKSGSRQRSELVLKSWRDCLREISRAASRRTMKKTRMNDTSSRSHTIFQLTITQEIVFHQADEADVYKNEKSYIKESKINLVDLAGSESIKKSGAEGQAKDEAAHINKSLSALKRVLDALSENAGKPIPYRDSTLTSYLMESLGGNCKTTMIACVSPHFDNQDETLSTLRYASKANAIVTNVSVNDTAELRDLALKYLMYLGLEDDESREMADKFIESKIACEKSLKTNKLLEEQVKRMRETTGRESGLYTAVLDRICSIAIKLVDKDRLEGERIRLEKDFEDTKNELGAIACRLDAATRDAARLSVDIEQISGLDRQEEEHYRALEAEAKQAQRLNSNVKWRSLKQLMLRCVSGLDSERRRPQIEAEADKQLTAMEAENEEELSKVIAEEAEKFELKVREFADDEIRCQQRIDAVEDGYNRARQEQDNYRSAIPSLVEKLQGAEKDHARRMQAIEAEWKGKYELMEKEYERRIQRLEEDYRNIQLHEVEKDAGDGACGREGDNHRLACRALEKELQKKEKEWKHKIDALLENLGDRIQDDIRKQEAASLKDAITTRKQCQERIAALCGELEHGRRILAAHESGLEVVQRVLRDMGRCHEKVLEPAPPETSAPLQGLKKSMRRLAGVLVSAPLTMAPTLSEAGAAPAAAAADIQQQSGDTFALASETSGRQSGMWRAPYQQRSPAFSVFSKERFAEINARRFDSGYNISGSLAASALMAKAERRDIRPELLAPSVFPFKPNPENSPTQIRARQALLTDPMQKPEIILGGTARSSPTPQSKHIVIPPSIEVKSNKSAKHQLHSVPLRK